VVACRAEIEAQVLLARHGGRRPGIHVFSAVGWENVDGEPQQFGVARKPVRDELLRCLRGFRNRVFVDFKFDRDDASARWFL
jgi:hypothetical protein